MNAQWMFDARKIPNEVMNYLRRIAVRAIEEKGYSPEWVADFLGIDRTRIYDWLRKYRQEGEESLDTRKAPGAERVITPDIDQWLKETILNTTPADHGYETVLWTLEIIVHLLKARFGLWVSDATARLHLHHLGLSCQQPCYQASTQDMEQVKQFLDE
ncbi:MAG: winged helix-turn-helix domain-containing protein [Candidatus Competibacteraceae bacterium]